MYSLAVLLIGIVLGSVSLTYPFGRDQGIYSYIGKLLLEGKIQYKYAFDLKPPGVHYVFAAAQSLLGESMFNMRVFDIFWQSCTGIVLFIITYNVTASKFAGMLSSFLYIFLYFRLDYWHTLQADGFLNLPFSLSILFLITLDIHNSDLRVLFSGIFFAIAVLFKYTILIFLPLLLLVFLLKDRKLVTGSIKAGIYFLLGLGLVFIAILGLYYLTDSLEQFMNIQFVQIPLYARIGYSTESLGFIVANTLRLFFGSVYSPIILISALLMVYLFRKKRTGYAMLIMIGWMLCSLVNLLIQWKFFVYHFLVIIPPFAVGAAVFISTIFKEVKRKYVPLLYASAVILGIAFIVYASRPYYGSYNNLISYLAGVKNLEQLYIQNGTTADSAFMISNTLKAVEFVKLNTREFDRIYVWGFDPLVYYLSGRDCISRFIYNYPLYWKGNNRDFQKEFMEDLVTGEPRLILVSRRDPLYYISGYHEDSMQMLLRFPEFRDFLYKKYQLVRQIDNFHFYVLKENEENQKTY